MKKTHLKSTVTAGPAKAVSSALPRPPFDAVSRRAREIWIARGSPTGCDEEIWFEAERQVAAEMQDGMPPLEDRGITVKGEDIPLAERVDKALKRAVPPDPRRSPTSFAP